MIRGLKNSSVPLYIFGTGFREMENFLNFQYLWERASLISVRGKTSVERVEEYDLDTSKIITLGDPIFLLEREKVAKENYIGGVTRPHKTDMSWMKNVFEFLKQVRQQDIRLFSFCEHQGDGVTGKSLGYKTCCVNIEKTYFGVAESSFFFGNRLHPFCIALMNSIPAIGVEIEFRKVEDVCSTLNYPYWIKANTPLEHFKDMYFDLMDNWKVLNLRVQSRIKKIKGDLIALVNKIILETRF